MTRKRTIATNGWSQWKDIEEAMLPPRRNGPFNYQGIYQIRVVNAKGKPIPIHRFVGVDKAGVIYIGRSGLRQPRTIQVRVREFDRRRHSGGITYDNARPILDNQPCFSKHRLQVKAKRLTSGKIRTAESRSINEYFSQYAELPPCNSTRPNTNNS